MRRREKQWTEGKESWVFEHLLASVSSHITLEIIIGFYFPLRVAMRRKSNKKCDQVF